MELQKGGSVIVLNNIFNLALTNVLHNSLHAITPITEVLALIRHTKQGDRQRERRLLVP